MALDLTDVRFSINNVLNGLKFEDDVFLRFYNVSTVIFEAPNGEGWKFRSLNTRNVANEPLYELSIADVEDEIDLGQLVPITTAVGINGKKYKFVQYDMPEGVTRLWKAILAPTGENE